MNSKNFSIMTFTDLMDKAFSLHKKHIGTSALYLFIFYIIGFVSLLILLFVGVIFFGITAMNFFDFGDFGGGDILPYMGFGGIVSIIILSFIILILIFLFELAKQVGIMDIASKAFFNKPVKFEKALGQAFKKIPAALSLIGAYGIIFLPITAIFGLIIAGIVINIEGTEAVIILLGVLLFIIYGYLGTIYMFSIQAAILEKLYFFKALKRSRSLVKNNFWKLLGINILFGLIVMAITYSIYSIFGIIGGLLYILLKGMDIGESSMAALIMIGNILRYPLQIIFSLFISPVAGIFHTILYYNQRFKKEGYDIELRLEQLKAQ